MTWKSHRVITFATVFLLTGDIVPSIAATCGSVFPDWIEGPIWKYWHRKYSHWIVFYLPFMAAFYAVRNYNIIFTFLFWLFVGMGLHIVEDSVCGPIPVWSPTKKKKVLPRLFYVGTTGEYLFVSGYCLIAIVLFFVKLNIKMPL